MSQVMQGVRAVEVAEPTLVPVASSLQSDWGDEVIKVEPVDRGGVDREVLGYDRGTDVDLRVRSVVA